MPLDTLEVASGLNGASMPAEPLQLVLKNATKNPA